MSDDLDTILTVDQVCERLQIHRATFWREAKRGNPNWPAKVQISAGRVGYLKSSVERYIACQQLPDAVRIHRNAEAANAA